jgi:hypothetical protein
MEPIVMTFVTITLLLLIGSLWSYVGEQLSRGR